MQEIRIITQRIESIGIPYCLVGGLAAIAYGRPRLTLDADLVLNVLPDQIHSLTKAFPLEDFYLPPEEVLLAEIQREFRGHFNIIHNHSALRADCYLPGKNPLALWELAHRQKIATASGDEWFAPPESIIVNKLLFFKEGGSIKHLEDIQAMVQSGSVQNFQEITRWVTHFGLEKEWSSISPTKSPPDPSSK